MINVVHDCCKGGDDVSKMAHEDAGKRTPIVAHHLLLLFEAFLIAILEEHLAPRD
jgi:hypothetical protein